MEFIRDLIKYALVIVFVILIKVYVMEPIQVNMNSMEPTFEDRDLLILNKLSYKFQDIKRFDIVVVKYDNPPFLVKRVIGLPGETLQYKDGILYINNEVVSEPLEDIETEDFGPITIEENHYFIVGDNRENSLDSRTETFGSVEQNMIEGRTSLLIWPFNRFGFKK
jgi:signal peptidase I